MSLKQIKERMVALLLDGVKGKDEGDSKKKIRHKGWKEVEEMHKRFQLSAAMDLQTLAVKVGEEFHKEAEMVVVVAVRIHSGEAVVVMVMEKAGAAMVMEKAEEGIDSDVAVVAMKEGEGIDSGMAAAVMMKAGEGAVMMKVGEGIDSGMAGVVMKTVGEGIDSDMAAVVI